jgi:hypothetical protein
VLSRWRPSLVGGAAAAADAADAAAAAAAAAAALLLVLLLVLLLLVLPLLVLVLLVPVPLVLLLGPLLLLLQQQLQQQLGPLVLLMGPLLLVPLVLVLHEYMRLGSFLLAGARPWLMKLNVIFPSGFVCDQCIYLVHLRRKETNGGKRQTQGSVLPWCFCCLPWW